jgi:hypothetical protein
MMHKANNRQNRRIIDDDFSTIIRRFVAEIWLNRQIVGGGIGIFSDPKNPPLTTDDLTIIGFL